MGKRCVVLLVLVFMISLNIRTSSSRNFEERRWTSGSSSSEKYGNESYSIGLSSLSSSGNYYGTTRGTKTTPNFKSFTIYSMEQSSTPPQDIKQFCIGTSGRMSVPSNRSHHYRNLKDRYTNCTYVEGNLELTWIQDEFMDLSFLQDIREVTGYVLISHVDVRKIVLPKLQVIRGRTRFRLNVHDDEFALMVTLSRMDNLELPALRDILAGNVGVFNNYNLCHVKTINWDEIISGVNAKYVYVYNYTHVERECPPCHVSCEAGCWGEGKENCQRFSKINCSPQCHEGRCFGKEPRDCCHLSCAGGCTGPRKNECIACKKFYDDGECKDECPSLVIYNPNTYLSERNPNGKYAYGATCVKECPEHLLRDAGAGACVRSCPSDKEQSEKGECVPCVGPCRKKCQGPPNLTIHSGNIESFRNCTIIDGSIQILDTSFSGFQEFHFNQTFGDRYGPMDPSQLEIFSTLKEITGFINIQGSHPNFTDLSYFRNLETIGGREKSELFSALYIVKTSLRSLNLRSLKKVRSGSVAILENSELCFASSVNWNGILGSKSEAHITNNRGEESCRRSGLTCSSQCSGDGCWGHETRDCLSCAKFKLDDMCIPSCNATVGIYEDKESGVCKHCSEECEGGCSGAGPKECVRCKNLKDGPFCVTSCPPLKYNSGGDCVPCHANCVGGCSGPRNTLGEGGCHSCQQAMLDENEQIVQCMAKDEDCPIGYYNIPSYAQAAQAPQSLKPLERKSICKKCHMSCKNCTAWGTSTDVCHECAFLRKAEQCVDECPKDNFFINEAQKECLPCASECLRCTGATAYECTACNHYRIYSELDDDNQHGNTSFICTNSCPPEFPHHTEDENGPYCAFPIDGKLSTLYIILLIGIFVFGIFLFLICLACLKSKQKRMDMKNLTKLFYPPSSSADETPIRPSNVRPNLSKFRTVKEEELRKGGILGYGAFGTVYKGVWIPEGQNVKIPVAIKVLRAQSASNTKEFLEEAYIMASVEHPHLLKLLSVCLADQLMLVTQLMPLGSLKEYVHNNRDKIGSKALLNWCTQIAKGMEYLESHRLVHRDLAARNVLVQTPTFVKITDFGLAKLLDLDEDEYKSEAGKLPIKWLALESIKDHVFTHKSDVWAFGITVWEVLTYGAKPYENIPIVDIADLLMKGERLPQPPNCTLELYMLIIKTWMVDPDTRPTFQELVLEFTKMSRDPGRYLVINGDKLLRLPTYTQQDENDLIRNLASALEGPELIMNASEYFEKEGGGGGGSNSNHGGGGGHSGHGGGGTMGSSNGRRNPYNMSESSWADSAPRSYSSRQGGRGRVHPHLNQHPITSASLRYCSDPLKELAFESSSSEGPYAPAQCLMMGEGGSMRMDLPVDEDDYLMPCPQNNSNSSPYLHLIGDNGKGIGCPPVSLGNGNFGHRTPRKHYPVLIDNPEYQLMAREYSNFPLAYAPIGLPTKKSTDHLHPHPHHHNQQQHYQHNSHSSSGSNNAPIGTNNDRVVGRRHGSRSEEESDHEYYNELDRLKREKQPLQQARKNETTV